MEQERGRSRGYCSQWRQSWQAERFSRVTLVFSAIHVIVSLLLFLPAAAANKCGFEVIRMIDDERLEECNLNLGRADVDCDGELHINE
jgi:hypothetical protein